MHLKPILKAILLCDTTIIEDGTRKRSIIGIFDRVRGSKFPLVHPTMSVYVQFLGVDGTFDFVLELVDLKDNRVTNRAEAKGYQVLDKTRECELVFNLMHVQFMHPGDYEFRIYIQDDIFGQKTMKVLE